MEKLLPTVTNEEFLTQCYRYFLSREPDTDGKKYYLDAMEQGMLRETITQILVSSDEFAHKFNSGNAVVGGNFVGASRKFVPEGHFYSPTPALDDYTSKYDSLALGDLDEDLVNGKSQIELAEKFRIFYNELPFPREPSDWHRYYLNNGAFNYFDGIVLYSFIRQLKPKRIIEVGSGFSSAAMIDTCEIFLEGKTDITFIEPYPSTLHNCLFPQDKERYKIIEKNVQDVALDTFRTLEKNDILFIDSSHVSKFGSDVNHLLFNVIPTLQEGVVIHFHDIFKNFDYPKEWLKEGRAWNEGYLIRAFLSNNKNFKILFFNDWFADKHWNYLEENLPLCTVQPQGSPFKNCGVSLWVQHVGNSPES